MKRNITITLICFLISIQIVFPQRSNPALDDVKRLVSEYMTLSPLGTHGGNINETTIIQFRQLFSQDAFLYWDLVTYNEELLKHPLTVNEYIDAVKKEFFMKQPILYYPPKRIKYDMAKDNLSCIVFMQKNNTEIGNDGEETQQQTVNLRLNIRFGPDGPLIYGISLDLRLPRLRSINLAGYYDGWDNIGNELNGGANSLILPQISDSLLTTVNQQFFYGLSADIRLNNELRNGTLITFGLYYQNINYSLSSGLIERTTIDTLDRASANPFTLTVFDRTNGIRDEVNMTNIYMPIGVKHYFKPYLYAKAAVQFGYSITKLSVNDYRLSHTGGGLVTNLANPNQQFLIDKSEDEIVGPYGFFRDRLYDGFEKDYKNSNVSVALLLTAGFEKQFNRFSFGVEPYVRIGTNPVYNADPSSDLNIYDIDQYQGLLSTVDLSSIQVNLGIGLYISYMLKR